MSDAAASSGGTNILRTNAWADNARRLGLVLLCGLLALTVVILLPDAARADDPPPPSDPITTPAEPSQSPWPDPVVTLPPVLEPGPSELPVPSSDPVAPPVVVPPPVVEPAPSVPATVPVVPAEPAPVQGNPLTVPAVPADPAGGAVLTPAEEDLPLTEAPAATESAAAVLPAPTPTATPTQQPRVDAVQAAVSAATGSPLVVQILTVAFLIGSGFIYFRAIGSKGLRVPTRSVK